MLVINLCSATYSADTTLPLVLAGKCETPTCSTLINDMDVVKACFTDPTDVTDCRGKSSRRGDAAVDGIEDGCRIYRLIVICKTQSGFSSAKQGNLEPVYRDY